MEIKNTIVDPIHIFNHNDYLMEELTKPISIYVAENEDTHQKFFLIKKGEKYDPDTKYSFINHIEKSFDLNHPSLVQFLDIQSKNHIYFTDI